MCCFIGFVFDLQNVKNLFINRINAISKRSLSFAAKLLFCLYVNMFVCKFVYIARKNKKIKDIIVHY